MPNPRFVITNWLASRRVAFPVLIVVLQSVAALYFGYDSMNDLATETPNGLTLEVVMECVATVSLIGGVILGLRHLIRVARELSANLQSLSRAQSAFAEHVARRFAEWRLTPGEGEVALFALKGYDVAEIARLRGAASGTVRSQLSQIYAKAEVSSQAMLVSLFIDDLLGEGSFLQAAPEQ